MLYLPLKLKMSHVLKLLDKTRCFSTHTDARTLFFCLIHAKAPKGAIIFPTKIVSFLHSAAVPTKKFLPSGTAKLQENTINRSDAGDGAGAGRQIHRRDGGGAVRRWSWSSLVSVAEGDQPKVVFLGPGSAVCGFDAQIILIRREELRLWHQRAPRRPCCAFRQRLYCGAAPNIASEACSQKQLQAIT